jgi:hypothetical protein
MTTEIANKRKELMDLADNMASAATTFNSHGYSMFIEAREEFKRALESVFPKVPNKDQYN